MYKKLSPGLKAKVALEAFREEKTLTQIASEYDVHPSQISRWKQELLKRAGELFSKPDKSKAEEQQKTKDKLHQAIGELKVENDWLKKKLNLLI